MTNHLPLTTRRAEAYVTACAGQERGPIAFVAVTPTESAEGIHAALGIAIANERGYMPVPLGWARYGSWETASEHADLLNSHIGLTDDQATRIIISTMGGMRYTVAA